MREDAAGERFSWRRALGEMVAFATFGCISIQIIVRACKDAVLYSGALAVTDIPFSVMDVVALLASICLVGILAFRLRSVRFQLLEALDDRISADANALARGRSYLIGRGCNETQAAVLFAIARGLSSAEICRELSYSRGAVNSARARGYRRLGIHSRSELVAVLSQDANLK